MSSPLLWFLLMLFCILIQGVYSMLEMAALSFNRVRLEYYANKGVKGAIWLRFLLQSPARLFGTVMLGINVALQVGSQSAREFYSSLGLNPDIAMITQTFFVVIIAELAPLFAARRYAEHVITLGIHILYGTYLLFAPFIFCVGLIARFIGWCMGYKELSSDFLISRDELQKILEMHQEGEGEGEEFNLVVSNIFSLRNKTAASAFIPLSKAHLMRATLSVKQFREELMRTSSPPSFIPLFHKQHQQIVAIAYLKDLIRAPEDRAVRSYARFPWFITQETPLIRILEQFRSNNQTVAIVLDGSGSACGILTLDVLLEEIFRGPIFEASSQPIAAVIERSFPGSMKIATFNKQFGVHIKGEKAETLSELLIEHLEHPPSKGESIILSGFEFTVEETSLMGVKTVTIKSLRGIK